MKTDVETGDGVVAEAEDLTNGETSYSTRSTTVDEPEKAEADKLDAMDRQPSSLTSNSKPLTSRPALIAALIILIGAGASAAILGLGITAAQRDKEGQFKKFGGDLLQQFEMALEDYVTAGLWLHQATLKEMTHYDFRVVYEYLNSSGLEFQAVSFAPRVSSDAERDALEGKTRQFVLENLPSVNYTGFKGLEPNPETGKLGPAARSKQDVYFPVHYVEPIEDRKNQAALDFDIYSESLRKSAIDEALRTYEPAMTERLKLIKEAEVGTDAYAYSVILMHPGIRQQSQPNDSQPQGLGVLAIRIPEVIAHAHVGFKKHEFVSVYIFDSTNSDGGGSFLGGAILKGDPLPRKHELDDIIFLDEVKLTDVRQQIDSNYILERHLPIARRQWTFVVADTHDSFRPELTFVILGATMIFVACICLALWVYTNSRRVSKISILQAAAESEKAAIMLGNARQATKMERELNDFIAHEVRNPLSAALAANGFVAAAVNETQPLMDEESRKSVREDVAIIDNSLNFINDLLRNMLDIHRASSKQLNIDVSPVDLRSDVFEPVASMLFRRDDNFSIKIDCPKDLVIISDRLRLKQIVLNLGRNAIKFVTKGFVQLRARVLDGNVHIYIEDSGPGLPMEKRKMLFTKFQESLDSLNQGTGIGLALCKNLVELMNGEIWLDENYDSGVEGCPGARFVIRLNSSPVVLDSLQNAAFSSEVSLDDDRAVDENFKIVNDVVKSNDHISTSSELPEVMSVLFVDDDMVLRKLFSRSVKRVAKDWKFQEASNGETALRMCETEKFDIIFVDMYMASVNKQLLGTETVRALRAMGVESIICGLSANDLEETFLKAGSDAFMMKPFPCGKEDLYKELVRVLNAAER